MDLANQCARWAASVCSPLMLWTFAAILLTAAGGAAAFAVCFVAARITRWREWRAAQHAQRAKTWIDPAEQRIEAVAQAALDAVARQAKRKRARTDANKTDLAEADWIAILTAATPKMRRRALRRAAPRRAPDDVLGALAESDAAFAAGDAANAHRAALIVAGHLCERRFAKAAMAHACSSVLSLRVISAPYDLVDAHIARLSHIAEELGCVSARTLSGLWRAFQALDRQELANARAHLESVDADGGVEIQIAAADLQARLAERHGNLARARDELRRREKLEQDVARTRRAARTARAHLFADLARLELLETHYRAGRRMRASGKRAERLLRRSAGIFLGARAGAALALVYTRLAMAAVQQHHLGAARDWAVRGRALAQAARLFDLASAADDLARRIDADRMARRDWLSLLSR